MDKMLYVANWKSNKFKGEGAQFIELLAKEIESVNLDAAEIVIAPPFTLLHEVRVAVDELALSVGVAGQNVSGFPQGAYTGEINAKQLRLYAEYVIIGHSERRSYFHEDENVIENKIREAKEAGLKVIQCIQNEDSVIHNGIEIVAYEPPSAIGSGNPDDPAHVKEVFEHIKNRVSGVTLLYGGSVKPENIGSYKSIPNIGGFLIGGASLEVDSFISLLS